MAVYVFLLTAVMIGVTVAVETEAGRWSARVSSIPHGNCCRAPEVRVSIMVDVSSSVLVETHILQKDVRSLLCLTTGTAGETHCVTVVGTSSVLVWSSVTVVGVLRNKLSN